MHKLLCYVMRCYENSQNALQVGTSCIWNMSHLFSSNVFISYGRFLLNYSIYKFQTYHVIRRHLRDLIRSFLMRKFSLELFYIIFLMRQ